MNNSLKALSAIVAASSLNQAYAATNPNFFRAEAPADRPIPANLPSVSPIPFRDTGDVAVRSAVALSSAGMVNGEFSPADNPGAGNFERRPYNFSFSVNQGFDDNIYNTRSNKQSSFYTTASVGTNIAIGDGRTMLQASLNVGGAYYWDRQDSIDPNITLSLDLSHAFSPKLRLDITSSLAYQAEPDFQSGFGQNRRAGNYFFGVVGFSLSQAFSPRLSAVYGYTFSGVYYEDSIIADASNRIDQTFSLQIRYLVQPTIALIGEYRFGVVTYDSTNRDSTSNYILGGLDFTLNRRLTAGLRVGAQFRDSDDLGQETAPFVEGTMSYNYGERSTIQWISRYGFEESEFGIGSTRKTYRTGLNVTQQISSRISASGGAYYSTSDYSGNVGGSEQTLDLSLGLVFKVNRLLSFQTGYTFTKVFADNSFLEYDRNRIFLGATISF